MTLREERLNMTPEERVLQRLSFAYGNLACSTNHLPRREAFQVLCVGPDSWYQLTQERFDEWADARKWMGD